VQLDGRQQCDQLAHRYGRRKRQWRRLGQLQCRSEYRDDLPHRDDDGWRQDVHRHTSRRAGTTQTTVSLVTDELATCRYGTAPGGVWGAAAVFGTTGGLTHTTLVTGLTGGISYTVDVRVRTRRTRRTSMIL
jgi:hypothetical protein